MPTQSSSGPNLSQLQSQAEVHKPDTAPQDNSDLRPRKDRKVIDFHLNCPEYRWLLEPPIAESMSDLLTEAMMQPSTPPSLSSTQTSTYITHNRPRESLGQRYEAAPQEARPSSSFNGFACQGAPHSPAVRIGDHVREFAVCIDPARLTIIRPTTVSIPPITQHSQCALPIVASHRPDLQTGESGQSNTRCFDHSTFGLRSSPEARSLVELNASDDEEYSRSQPPRGPANLSPANTPLSEDAGAMEEQVVIDKQPKEAYEMLNGKVIVSQPTHRPLAPSPSTSTSASEDSSAPSEAWLPPPTSPQPLPPSLPIRSPSAASLSSPSSSRQSTKRKRENEALPDSSSTPTKKSKRDCKSESQGPARKQATRHTQSGPKIPQSQTAAPKKAVLRGAQTKPAVRTYKWKIFEHPPVKSRSSSAPSPSTTSTASENSGSPSWEAQSSPTTSSKPSSHSDNSLSSASTPSSSGSSSSSQQSAKRKRQGDEPSASSSRSVKKSKVTVEGKSQGPSRGKVTTRTHAGLRLRSVVDDPNLPKPDGNWIPCSGQRRIEYWPKVVEVDGEGKMIET